MFTGILLIGRDSAYFSKISTSFGSRLVLCTSVAGSDWFMYFAKKWLYFFLQFNLNFVSLAKDIKKM